MKKGFLFKSIRSMVVLAAATGIALFLFTAKSEPEKKEHAEAIPVADVISVMAETKVMRVETYGTVKPRQSLKISAEVPGRVEFLNSSFDEGGFIKKGELLIRIDPRTYRFDKETCQVGISLAEADISRLNQDVVNLNSNIILAKANLKLSKKELARLKTLVKGDFATKNSLDMAFQREIESRMGLLDFKNRLAVTDSVMKQLDAALAMARINLAKAELALEKSEIRADFDGYVLQKMVEKGEYVNVGQTLGAIYVKDLLDVDVSIPLEKMKWLEPVFKRGIAPRVELRMSSGDGDGIWYAHIARIKAKIDEKTRTLPMVLEVEAEKKGMSALSGLRPGTFVRCFVHGEEYDNLFVVPRHLLKPGNILHTVKNGRLVNKKVKILRKFQDKVYIAHGLTQGDKIISSPLPEAVDGMKIHIRN